MSGAAQRCVLLLLRWQRGSLQPADAAQSPQGLVQRRLAMLSDACLG